MSNARKAGIAAQAIVERELETLRNDPVLGKYAGKALSPEEKAAFDVWWPDEAFESRHGGTMMKPESEAALETLFERFGVPLKVKENSIATVGHAYDVFGIALSSAICDAIEMSGQFPIRKYLDHWPSDWLDYIESVINKDTATARRLANKLQPLAPECQFPPGVHVDDQRKRPGQD